MSETEFDSTTLLLQLDRVCDRFEHDWQAGAAPSLEAYLAEFVEQFESGLAGLDPHSPEAKRRGLVRSNLLRTLVENLLGIEVEYRRRAGEEIPWESYRHRFRSFPTAVANARSKARAEETRTDDFQLAQSAVVPEDHAPESHQVHEGVELPPRFEFRGVLGEGTFGVVCQAWDRTLQRQVAVKSPKSTAIRRDLFLREARAASRLRHPHIVRVYDILQLEERTYIVSDFIEGNDFAR